MAGAAVPIAPSLRSPMSLLSTCLIAFQTVDGRDEPGSNRGGHAGVEIWLVVTAPPVADHVASVLPLATKICTGERTLLASSSQAAYDEAWKKQRSLFVTMAKP